MNNIKDNIEKNTDKYNRAIVKILFELDRTLSYRNVINEIVRVAPIIRGSFFKYTYYAMYDAMFFHAIKILENHKHVASFWYLYKYSQNDIEKYLSKYNLTINEVTLLSDKLKILRNKTHFHIDKTKISNPDIVWKQANITGDFFNSVMDNLWNGLRDFHLAQLGKPFIQQNYYGNDIESITQAIQDKGITI